MQKCFEEITAYGRGSVMFWAINSTQRTELVLIENGTLNAHRYLIPQPALNALEEDSIFIFYIYILRYAQ